MSSKFNLRQCRSENYPRIAAWLTEYHVLPGMLQRERLQAEQRRAFKMVLLLRGIFRAIKHPPLTMLIKAAAHFDRVSSQTR